MNANDSLVKAYEFLLENSPATAQDIYEGIEIFKTSLEYGSEAISQMIRESSNDFSRIATIIEHGKVIEELQKQVSEYLADFSMKKSIDEDEYEEELPEDDNEEEKVVNYADYAVNSNIPHNLSESFIHKRICGFMMDNTRYNTSTWKDALIKVSELLYDEDKVTFQSFVNSPAFKGRKNKYFSDSSNGNHYYIKMKNADIYIWTNLSATAICKIIKTMLTCYKKPVNSLFIYLRADYTALHTTGKIEEKSNETVSEEKIGKYVRRTMRNLSSSGFNFSTDMITRLTSSDETKKMFGIGMPFLKAYDKDGDISAQIKDNKGNGRYWKEVFEFNGKFYLVVSQWQEFNRERFNNWLNTLEN